VLESGKSTFTYTPPITSKTSKEANRASTTSKENEPTKDKVPKPMKLLPAPNETSKDEGVAQNHTLGQVKLPSTTKEVPKEKGVAQVTVNEPSVQLVVKTNPPSSQSN